MASTSLVWLVTGCSSGFGEQFVHDILSRGDKVIATARTLSKLDKLRHLEPQSNLAILQLDITDSQKSIGKKISEAISIYGKIDVLVNNAGYIQAGTWEGLEYEDLVAQFDTNVFGAFKVTRAILPHFRQHRSGTIVFVSSRSGWIGDSCGSAYAGSKFALEGLAESLAGEVAHLGIRIILPVPGPFRTPFLSPGNLKAVPDGQSKSDNTIADYATMYRTHLQNLATNDRKQPGDPRKFVEIVVDLVRGDGVARDRFKTSLNNNNSSGEREVAATTTAALPQFFRLPIGSDVCDDIRDKCLETLRTIEEEWAEVIRGTDLKD